MPYVRMLVPLADVERDPELARIVNRQDGSKEPPRDVKALVNKYPTFTTDVTSTST